MSWRNATIVLAILAAWLLWRDCTRAAIAIADAPITKCSSETRTVTAWSDSDRTRPSDDEPSPAAANEPGGPSINGFRIPSWALWLAPHPGEDYAPTAIA